jgi:hypothetical protein
MTSSKTSHPGSEPPMMDVRLTVIFSTYSPEYEDFPLQLRRRLRSVQYRLLSGAGEYDDITETEGQNVEVYRLGILLYLGILQNEFFWVPSMGRRLVSQLRYHLADRNFVTGPLCVQHVWLLFLTSAISLDPFERLWIVESVATACSQLLLSKWDDVKSLLEKYGWVGRIQDKSGRDMWNEVIDVRQGSQVPKEN